jgi:hypothetical protein
MKEWDSKATPWKETPQTLKKTKTMFAQIGFQSQITNYRKLMSYNQYLTHFAQDDGKRICMFYQHYHNVILQLQSFICEC